MPLHLLRLAPLVVLLLMAAVSDLRTRRIPNWLVLLLILSGLARSALLPGAPGLLPCLAGMFASAMIPFAMFTLGALGAGDVKLMAGVGAWLGPVAGPAVFLLAILLGMLIVLAQAAATGRMPALFGNTALILVNFLHVRQVGIEHASSTGRSARSIGRTLPYAVPVLMAAMIVLFAWR